MKHKTSRYLLPLALLLVMIVGSTVLANNNEYNTTFPQVFNGTLHTGTKSDYVIYARHRVISSDIVSYTVWINYAQPNSNSWTTCTNNYEVYLHLPTVPPVIEYDHLTYTAVPAVGSRTRLRTSTTSGLFSTKWVHGEIIY
ncbi:MAG: hypothetical protein J5493_02950 [Lachnospiraceae bacterium]|nr:hypothetical protein [Lachnospiraceae bacterium]